MLIQVCRDDESFVLPPFGGEEKNLPVIMQKLYDKYGAFEMRGIYDVTINRLNTFFADKLDFVTDRANSDYIYLSSDLAALAGRKFHQKKNHVNSFRKTYPGYQYLPMDSSMAEECIAFAQNWKDQRELAEEQDDESLRCELCAIKEALNNFDALGIKGGVILIDGKVEAMTFGEQINHDTAVIHVEKANPAIRGLYATINQEFCQREWSNVRYINREEDMGIEGLRKAKESYNPVFLLNKYTTLVDMGAWRYEDSTARCAGA